LIASSSVALLWVSLPSVTTMIARPGSDSAASASADSTIPS
jgi:hypothetical protein